MARFFGDEIRRLRQRCGLTQRELAALAGLTQAQISLHEKGEDVPAPRVRAKYARALGLSLEELQDLISRDRLKNSLRSSPMLSEEAKRSIEDYIDFAWDRDRQARAQGQQPPETGGPEG